MRVVVDYRSTHGKGGPNGQKKYRVTKSCPQCGCFHLTPLTEEQLKEKYKDVPNVELECHECLMKFEADVEKDLEPEDE